MSKPGLFVLDVLGDFVFTRLELLLCLNLSSFLKRGDGWVYIMQDARYNVG